MVLQPLSAALHMFTLPFAHVCYLGGFAVIVVLVCDPPGALLLRAAASAA
jgi:hypothetical protein